MIEQLGPCSSDSPAVAMFNALLNAATLVLCAFLTRRAVGKDAKERRSNGHASDAR